MVETKPPFDMSRKYVNVVGKLESARLLAETRLQRDTLSNLVQFGDEGGGFVRELAHRSFHHSLRDEEISARAALKSEPLIKTIAFDKALKLTGALR
ncbi:MAG: hypothetical protein AAF851_09295 [Myxococcota bacterium]